MWLVFPSLPCVQLVLSLQTYQPEDLVEVACRLAAWPMPAGPPALPKVSEQRSYLCEGRPCGAVAAHHGKGKNQHLRDSYCGKGSLKTLRP